MSEEDAVQRARVPATVLSLCADLTSLGVTRRMTLLVPSSLSVLGYVSGGAPAVILALETVLGPEGTLVMPTHSGDLSDPADWRNPPVPAGWWETSRETIPAFDPDLTPTRKIGMIPETFRKHKGVLRNLHPQVSFAALNDSDFRRIGEQFAHDTGLVRSAKVASTDALLFPQRALVD